MIVAAVGILVTTGIRADPAAEPRPNIVWIVTDDQGYADLGYFGSKRIRTPHIDALARGGVRFTQAYVTHPYCSPSRAGLLTGRYQQRFGHENNPAYLPENHEIGLPVGEVTIADVLKSAGYATAAVGKWHLGAGPPFHPLRRGFGEFFGFLGGGRNYFPGARKNDVAGEEYSAAIEHNGEPVELDGYLTHALSDQAADFVRRHRDRPFFLYLAYNAPHTPYQAPKRIRRRFADVAGEDCPTYAAMISAVDDGVGQLVETLRHLEIDRHTVIFFLSDNGGQSLYECADNRPLRGRKSQLYEGGVRVPLVVAWPGRLAAGGVYEAAVSSLDIFATAAALSGAVPSSQPIDGVDLLPYLVGERQGVPHETLFWRIGGGHGWALRHGRWKLIGRRRGGELYDLEADIGETHDLAAEHPELVQQLTGLYRSWNRELVRPLWRNPS